MSRLRNSFRTYLVAGFLVLIPIGATFSLLRWIIQQTDRLLLIEDGVFLWVIPEHFHPNELVGFHIPGLGILLTIVFVFAVGVITRNFIGRRLVRWGDHLIDRIPFVRAIYNSIKQILETALRSGAMQFRKVAIIQYPRQGLYTLAFVTGQASNTMATTIGESPLISLFVPTTPNPTSGFYLMAPEKDIIYPDMTTEQAFKIIISGGILNLDEVRQLNGGDI